MVLGKMGQKNPGVLARLTPLLKSPELETRRGAIQALGAMGTAGSPAVDALVVVMSDPADPMSEEAVEALNNIGTFESLRAAEGHTRKAYLDRKTQQDKPPAKKK